jgi:hypothetical protein
MPISVRLDKKMEHVVQETAKILRTTGSDVIERSLSDYCSQVLKTKKRRPYELIQDLLGRRGSGGKSLASKGEEILRERFRKRR